MWNKQQTQTEPPAAPSCNRISGEDLRQRGSSACLLQGLCFEHVLYPWRHAFVFITSERSSTIRSANRATKSKDPFFISSAMSLRGILSSPPCSRIP